MDSRAETEGLRTENQSLRNVVQQTNQKLNALISIQMQNADGGGDAVNEELRMLRSKTATLEAEIEVPPLHCVSLCWCVVHIKCSHACLFGVCYVCMCARLNAYVCRGSSRLCLSKSHTAQFQV